MSTPRETFLLATKAVLERMTGPRPWGGVYQNTPRVEIVFTAPQLQNYQPYLALVQESGSQIEPGDHGGDEDDDFRFDVYGQVVKTEGVSPREWVNNLMHDVAATLRGSTRATGELRHAGCQWINFGTETVGYDENAGDFILPCTARLNYVLAPIE